MEKQMSGYAEIGLEHIIPSEMNYRKKINKTSLDELTESVRQKGILQPIIVRPVKGNGKYEIIAGHRRYQAAMSAGLETIPAIIEQFDDEAALEVAITENSQREDANPMDEARGLKLMLDAGTEVETIAARIGRTVGYVLGRVKLLDLCKEAQAAILKGKISLGHAQVLLRLRSKSEQRSLLAAMLDGDGMTVSGAKSIVRRHSLSLNLAPFDTNDCLSCQYRSGNQAMLFPELKDTDECSDPACYSKKIQAHYEAQSKEKEEHGFRVIRSYEEIKELGGFNSKMNHRIVAKKNDADYQSVYPPKYKSDCSKCTDHHAWYFYEENNYSGPHMETGELCLNPKCLQKMLREIEDAETQERRAADDNLPEYSGSKISPVTLRLHAEACRDRFMINRLPEKITASAVLSKRFVIYHMLDRFSYFNGNAKKTRDEILKDICPPEYFKEKKFSGWELYLVVMEIPKEKLNRVLSNVIAATVQFTDPKVLLHMTPEAGIDMTADFQMDKEFLNTKKKAELVETVKSLDLPIEFTGKEKKSEMVEAILALDLTGKATPEIAESCKLKELKDVSNPVEYGYHESAEEEAA